MDYPKKPVDRWDLLTMVAFVASIIAIIVLVFRSL